MALNSFKPKKIFYSIGEVAEMFQITESTLRYWEKEFDTIKPSKTIKGTRQYKEEDIEAVRLVHYLVKEKGLTLAGAKQKLKENKETVINTEEIVHRLKNLRQELILLRNEFEALENINKANGE